MSRNIFKSLIATAFLTSTQVFADTCVTTIAGSGVVGTADGAALSAQFNYPYQVYFSRSGGLIISETGNNKLRKLDTNGIVTTIAGNGTEGAQDGYALSAMFYQPIGITMDTSGNIFIAEYGNSKIRKLNTTGYVTTFAGSGGYGNADGVGTNAVFNGVTGIVTDSSGNMFVSDMDNNLIRKVTPAGVVTTFAGSSVAGNADGSGTAAQFNSSTGLAIDASNNIYVADTYNGRIRKITPAGVVTTVAGSVIGFADGSASSAKFRNPYGVAVDPNGTIYVADTLNHMIRMIKNGIVTTIAGNGTAGFADGAGSTAMFNLPYTVTLDPQGNLIVTDTNNARIRKLSFTDCVSNQPSTPSTTPPRSSTAPSGLAPTQGVSNSSRSARINPPSAFAGIWSTMIIAVTFLF